LGKPQEEPSAEKPLARICEGDAEWLNYSTITPGAQQKLIEMKAFPAHGHLNHPVQLAQRDAARHPHAPPVMGLTPSSQTLTCTMASASTVLTPSAGDLCGRLMPTDYRFGIADPLLPPHNFSCSP